MDLRGLCDAVSLYPALRPLAFDDVYCFFRFSCLAKPAIELRIADRRIPPSTLPQPVINLLAGALQYDTSIINTCWLAFRHAIWAHDNVIPSDDEIRCYNKFGLAEGLGAWVC